MNEQEQNQIDNIEQYGCHIIHVFEEDDLPRFTYSIGIYKKTGQPELIITGLKREVAHWAINEYNRRVKSGESFEPDKYYAGFLEGFDVTFKVVAKAHYPEHFGRAIWYYENDAFPVYQLVFPTTSGVWPWDKDVPAEFLAFQPLLNAS